MKASPDGAYWYLFKLPAEITGADLKEGEIQAGTDQDHIPQIQIGFTKHGAEEFQAITKADYDRGKLLAGLHGATGPANQEYVQHNAVVLDNRLLATPYIDYADNLLSGGIAGGTGVINNLGSIREANNLALVLRSGSLPYRLVKVSYTPGCGRS